MHLTQIQLYSYQAFKNTQGLAEFHGRFMGEKTRKSPKYFAKGVISSRVKLFSTLFFVSFRKL